MKHEKAIAEKMISKLMSESGSINQIKDQLQTIYPDFSEPQLFDLARQMHDRFIHKNVETKVIADPIEKARRFDEATDGLYARYSEGVWFDQSDPVQLLKNGEFELLEIREGMTKSFLASRSEYTRGFQFGIIACVSYLREYTQDWGQRNMGETDFSRYDPDEVVEIDGEKYSLVEGKSFADEMFPEYYVSDDEVRNRA